MRLPLHPIVLTLLLVAGHAGDAWAVRPDGVEFFESKIRPLLLQHCVKCHGEKKQSGGLRVDSLSALIEGGDRGPALVSGDPDHSLIVAAIENSDDLQMPPNRSLASSDIDAIRQWIAIGAPWPDAEHPTTKRNLEPHWAFLPIRDPVPPAAPQDWARSPIDAFVLRRLVEVGLEPAKPADRATLIRRLSYTLTGLPPTTNEIEAFVTDTRPDAHVALIDRLLASTAYGEHWARHWLDLARYSDTKGYVYAREERRWVHAWAYRDWVVSALNENMPYDRFLRLQLSADQVVDRRRSDLAAMGFLTLGRRFLGVKRDIIDDRIDVMTRATLGLTVSCARCHDHKYDPIPTEDYYALYGVFDSCFEQLVQLETSADGNFQTELSRRQQTLAEKLHEARTEAMRRCRQRTGDYLKAQRELEKYPANGFDQIFQKDDLLPAFVRRWEAHLDRARRESDPIFHAWHAFASLSPEEFSAKSATINAELLRSSDLNRKIAAEFTSPPKNFDEVIRRYESVFAAAVARRERHADSAKETIDSDAAAIDELLFGRSSPCFVPDEPIVQIETFFDSNTCTNLWKQQGEVDRLILETDKAPFALTLNDRDRPSEARVFVRGNPLRKGKLVTRRFLTALTHHDGPFRDGSGRRELADAIVAADNPLTARVIVNRIWTYHFGRGLVTTSSDFGTRAQPPSHPELLDWLSARLIKSGWDLKQLHRTILLSATYQQSSKPDDVLAARAIKLDPDNRLLWRMNPKRLSFEEYRDSILCAGGDLERTVGGQAADLFGSPFPNRRTIYGQVDRQYLPGTLRVFDFANPDLHVARRGETTVPQQALFLMNHPLILERAKAVARVLRSLPDQQRIEQSFQVTLRRSPSLAEQREALELVESNRSEAGIRTPPTAADWQYGLGEVDEEGRSVIGFTPLPHFTGDAWQGSDKYPDPKLGWVQLTATGGHPGNTRKHAAIRRWTAPRDMTVRIHSKLVHEPQPGDGIRAFLIASGKGILAKVSVHQSAQTIDHDAIDVKKGDTIDFVVDIGDVLHSDQYLWHKTIRSVDPEEKTRWDSNGDFPKTQIEQLDPWEQLAQILLLSNEFCFVD